MIRDTGPYAPIEIGGLARPRCSIIFGDFGLASPITKKMTGRGRVSDRSVAGLDDLPEINADQLAGILMVSANQLSMMIERGVIRPTRKKIEGSKRRTGRPGRPIQTFLLIDSVQDYCVFMRRIEGKKPDADEKIKAARAREVEVRTAQREKKLVDIEEANVLLDGVVGAFRARLTGLASQVTTDLRIRNTIDKALEGILTQIADDFQAKADVLNEGQSLLDEEIEGDTEDDVLEVDDAA